LSVQDMDIPGIYKQHRFPLPVEENMENL
jgi:hypothetical protein